jgi:hypothetical protein
MSSMRSGIKESIFSIRPTTILRKKSMKFTGSWPEEIPTTEEWLVSEGSQMMEKRT